ncbi:MAG: NAD-dependent epimerase/dehydratase family protein [Candidatus Eisenbacteria bacterium]|uniref:NAD-dependent epimerase/dehydratase family protein n=1 Tax=Eiseniibacteriota bacterium TaxID=2212470 RepID=A0A538T5X7_UNCEI|nr:MAG: NAD-dependent epimerase/dehydratase family protein [Candidatus Eisenbacteria bacterium]
MSPFCSATRASSRRLPAGNRRSPSSRRSGTSWSTGGPASPLRTLITGVAGFVGRHLARELAKRPKEELYGADHVALGYSDSDGDLRAKLKSHRPLDVRDFGQVAGWVRECRPDRIVHLAAQSSGAESIRDPAGTYLVNAVGTLHLLEAVRAEAPEAMVLLVGSADVYGTGSPGQKIREDAPMKPMNPYAFSKAAQDSLGELYAGTYRLNIVRTRTFSHTGPGQQPRFALAGFADQLARIDAGLVAAELRVGNLEGVRDYGDVRDVVRAYDALLERGGPGETYNVCTGRGHVLRDLLEILCGAAGFKPTIVQDPERMRSRDADYLVGDPTKLRSKTRWSPDIPIERTLQDLYTDARERLRREIGR